MFVLLKEVHVCLTLRPKVSENLAFWGIDRIRNFLLVSQDIIFYYTVEPESPVFENWHYTAAVFVRLLVSLWFHMTLKTLKQGIYYYHISYTKFKKKVNIEEYSMTGLVFCFCEPKGLRPSCKTVSKWVECALNILNMAQSRTWCRFSE